LVPISRLPKLIERRLDGLWVDEDFRAEREEQMRFLLEFTPRAPEIPELARGYAATAQQPSPSSALRASSG
jgi:hypothetical protein